MANNPVILFVINGSEIPEWLLSLGFLLLAGIIGVIFRILLEDKLSSTYESDRPVFNQLIKSVDIFLTIMFFLWGAYLFDIPILGQLFSLGVSSAIIGIIITVVGSAVISGLLLIQSDAYEAGDVIEIPDRGIRGIVEEVTLLNTRLRLPNDSYLVIPNRSIRNRDIINRSSGEDTLHRTSVDILITYESDLEEALETMEEAAEDIDEIEEGSPMNVGQWTIQANPTSQVVELSDNGIKTRLMYWVEEPCNIGAIKTDLFKSITSELNKTDVDFAYPHNHIYFDNTSGDVPVKLKNDQKFDD